MAEQGALPRVMDEVTRKRLVDSGAQLTELKGRLEYLKELGIDVSTIVEKIEWAEKAREVILRMNEGA